MQYKNKLGLPQYIVDWLLADNYDYNNAPNTISATTLLKPLRAQVLSYRHASELEVDVSELIASRYGTSIHDSIEKVQTPGVQKETRVSRTVEVDGVVFTVTGKYDLLVQEDDGTFTLRDIKTTSVWSYIHGGKDKDYRAQLSIYRWLLSETHNLNPSAFIDFYFTDWQGVKARTDKSYPQSRIQPGYKIDLLSVEDTDKMIREKLKTFKEFRDVHDHFLPECTKEELWASEDTYAVYKIGNKKATKVFKDRDSAENFSESKGKSTVSHRPGKVKRCNYCSAAPFCNQFERLKELNQIAE